VDVIWLPPVFVPCTVRDRMAPFPPFRPRAGSWSNPSVQPRAWTEQAQKTPHCFRFGLEETAPRPGVTTRSHHPASAPLGGRLDDTLGDSTRASPKKRRLPSVTVTRPPLGHPPRPGAPPFPFSRPSIKDPEPWPPHPHEGSVATFRPPAKGHPPRPRPQPPLPPADIRGIPHGAADAVPWPLTAQNSPAIPERSHGGPRPPGHGHPER